MNNKGFTLIELMIVVAIIGILGAVIIPLFFGRGSKIVTYETSQVQEEPKIIIETESPQKESINNCNDGKRTITLDGEEFFLGRIKNSWGDLEGVPCQ